MTASTIDDVIAGRSQWAVIEGSCPEALAAVPDGSVDAVVCDPPYPEVDRPYGNLSEPEWHALMDGVVAQCRRVLAPRGSAVFVLQPNAERVGRMRVWLWEFMARWGRAWNMPQDAWWWNPAAMPTVHCARAHGLMRGSVKACVWLGPEDCFRAQDRVLWRPSETTVASARAARAARADGDRVLTTPSGHHKRTGRILGTPLDRDGSTPFNLLPISNTGSAETSGAYDHGAGTPRALAAWWVRYLCPPGGLVLDPFCGAGTVPLAALDEGCRAVGVERGAQYAAAAAERCARAARQQHLFAARPRLPGLP